MAILLRNIETGFFYVGYNRWRVYPEEAFDFKTLERANRWVNTLRLAGVEVVCVGHSGARRLKPRRPMGQLSVPPVSTVGPALLQKHPPGA